MALATSRSVREPEGMLARRTAVLRWLVPAILAVPLLSACSGSHTSAAPCGPFGRVNDQQVTTVGAARTWGPVARGEHRYPGYADSDRLGVCLLPDGTVKGIFLKDGHQQVLWHQSPAARLTFPT